MLISTTQIKNIIISNEDIFFDSSLELLSDFNWKAKFLALTPYCTYEKGRTRSAKATDSWIYKSPLGKYPTPNLKMGIITHDTRFVYQMIQHDFIVLNPSLDIISYHHDSVTWLNKDYMKSKAKNSNLFCPWRNKTCITKSI